MVAKAEAREVKVQRRVQPRSSKRAKQSGSPILHEGSALVRCDTCGNEYDKIFRVQKNGQTYTFDCFECAIHRLAPACAHCGCRVLGHGVEAQESLYCCASCARAMGNTDLRDRVNGARVNGRGSSKDDGRRSPITARSPAVAKYMTSGPHEIGPRDTLLDARHLMEKHRIRHLPVTTGGRVVGILSDRDLEIVWMLADAPSEKLTVRDAMTSHPYTVAPDTPVNEVAREMAQRKIASAVVVERGRIAGVFTSTDAMNALASVVEGSIERPAESADRNGHRKKH